jgi:hypothetical protein
MRRNCDQAGRIASHLAARAARPYRKRAEVGGRAVARRWPGGGASRRPPRTHEGRRIDVDHMTVRYGDPPAFALLGRASITFA